MVLQAPSRILGVAHHDWLVEAVHSKGFLAETSVAPPLNEENCKSFRSRSASALKERVGDLAKVHIDVTVARAGYEMMLRSSSYAEASYKFHGSPVCSLKSLPADLP